MTEERFAQPAANGGAERTMADLRLRVAELETEIAEMRRAAQIQDLSEQAGTISRQHLRNILDSLFAHVVITRPDGLVLRVSRSLLDATGYTGSEVEDRLHVETLLSASSPLAAERLRAAIKRASEGQSQRFDISINGRSGALMMLDFMVSGMRDDSGVVSRLVCCAVDISDRVGFERALAESESRFRTTFENVAVGMAQLSLDGRWIAVNDKLCEIFGYQRSELLQFSFRELSHPADRGRGVTLPDRMLSGDAAAPASVEKRYLRKNGTVVWANVTASPSINEAGQTEYLIAVVEDITARKRAELDLRQSEQKFRTLADHIPQLAWMADASGWIYWYNQRWYRYTGTTPEQMEGWGWRSVHDPAILPDVLKGWNAALEKSEPFQMVFPLRGADGNFRPFLTQVLPVRDGQGRIASWFGTNTDITEQKRIEDALRRSNEDLEQFAYAASHDLQEPIRTVATLTQLLQRRLEASLDHESDEWMQHVIESAKRMGTLVADLMTYSRATLDGNAPSESVDINQVLQDSLAQLRGQIEERQAEILTHPLPTLPGRAFQIGQVFQNLISNAIRFAKPGTTPRIEISAQHRGSEWKFAVRDEGLGFNPEYRDRVFGVFKRLHGREIPGNGIGLAICKAVVERHGGRIWADSAEGEGATFFFTLPV